MWLERKIMSSVRGGENSKLSAQVACTAVNCNTIESITSNYLSRLSISSPIFSFVNDTYAASHCVKLP